MKAFRCSRTGLMYPSDYVENWGRKYGIGLGPQPISEALTNRYDIPIAEAANNSRTMHPVGVCRSQVDLIDVTPEEFEENRAVLAIDDINMERRGGIMRDRQIVHGVKMQNMFPEEHKRLTAEVVVPEP